MDDVVPLLRIHLPHHLVDGDACVVDQDVHVPVPLEDLPEDAEDVLVVAHVALVDAHAAVGVLVGELPCVVVIGRVAGRHRDAAVEQPLADGQPDAAGPAGDHRDLPLHVTHDVLPMLSVWRTCPWHPRWPGAPTSDSPAALRRTPCSRSTSGPPTACRPPTRGPAASRPCPAMPTACSPPQPPTRGESPGAPGACPDGTMNPSSVSAGRGQRRVRALAGGRIRALTAHRRVARSN